MSSAKRHPIRSAEAGFTFVEVAISLVILTMMALVVERTLAGTHDAERYLNGIRKSTERGQRIAYEVRDAVSASRKLYQNDLLGQGYLNALDFTRDPILPTARLPVFDELGVLGPDDPTDPRTGNILLFVREADAAPAIANPATKKVRYIDTYRFICVYPRETNRYIVSDEPRQFARDLVLWRSEAFPNHAQIMAISDPIERQAVAADLFNRFEYDLAWDPNASVATGFYALDAIGNVAAAPSPSITIGEDQNLSDRGRLCYANVQLARTDSASHPRRAIFTTDPAWNPDGFEVKVVGQSGSRKVWLHLVVEVQAAKGKVAAHTSTLIASTRDL